MLLRSLKSLIHKYLLKYRLKKFSLRQFSSIRRIAFVYDANDYLFEVSGLRDVLEKLSEDYDFTFWNYSSTLAAHIDLKTVDFVLVWTSWGSELDKFVRVNRIWSVPLGFIHRNTGELINKDWTYEYDVIWAETFFDLETFKGHPKLFHACGPLVECSPTDTAIENLVIYEEAIDWNLEEYIPQHSTLIKVSKGGALTKQITDTVRNAKKVWLALSNNNTCSLLILISRMLNKEIRVIKPERRHKEVLEGPQWTTSYFVSQLREGLGSIFSKEKIYITNKIYPSSKLMVGRHSFHNGNLRILGDQPVTIGSFCSLGSNISIITVNHDTNYTSTQGFIFRRYFQSKHPGETNYPPSRERSKGPVQIGSDVWIGDNVIILSGVSIGNGAVVAAGSVVVKNVDCFSVVGGNPAKLLKKRFSDKAINFLSAEKWWDWSDKKIKDNRSFFYTNWNDE